MQYIKIGSFRFQIESEKFVRPDFFFSMIGFKKNTNGFLKKI